MEPAVVMSRIFERAEQMGLGSKISKLSGLSPARIAEMRTASTPVSSTEYEQLCRAVAIDATSMYLGEGTQARRIPARFRAAISMDRPNADDVRNLALAAEQGRILGRLLTSMHRPIKLSAHRQPQGAPLVHPVWREGYDLGERARAALEPEPGAILELEQLLHDLGVHVARIKLSSKDVDAASIWEPGAVPIILLNVNSERTRHPGALRATLAHELCHLLHDAGDNDLTTQVSWGTEGRGNHGEDVEVRARAFAPAFLAPRSMVKQWATTLPKKTRDSERALVAVLASHWGLSFEGAAWHAGNCGLVAKADVGKLAALPRKPNIALDAFETVPSGLPPVMMDESLPERPAPLWDGWATEMVLGAFEEGHISVGRARELLSWV